MLPAARSLECSSERQRGTRHAHNLPRVWTTGKTRVDRRPSIRAPCSVKAKGLCRRRPHELEIAICDLKILDSSLCSSLDEQASQHRAAPTGRTNTAQANGP